MSVSSAASERRLEIRKRVADEMAARKSEDPEVKARACLKLKGTKVCQHAYDPTRGIFQVHRCRRGARCGFAHSKQQHMTALLGTLCSWDLGSNCCRKGRRCMWLHSTRDQVTNTYRNETADEYKERTGRVLGELPHEIRARRTKEASQQKPQPKKLTDKRTIPGLGKPIQQRHVNTGTSFAAMAAAPPRVSKTPDVNHLQGAWQHVETSSRKKLHFRRLSEVIQRRHLSPFIVKHLAKLKATKDAQQAELDRELTMRKQADAAMGLTKVDALEQILTKYNMLSFISQLKTLGVDQAPDLAFVEQADANGLGMSTIQMRKFQRMQVEVA